MSRAIIVNFFQYTPFGKEFYRPIYDYFIHQLSTYKNEFDTLYLIDPNWNIENPPEFAKVIKVSPHLRYYDAFKEVLPQIKEDLVLFMDNDMIVYREGIINTAFELVDGNEWEYDVVSIMDTIGTWKSDKLGLGNKFCPYWFGTRKEVLLKYRDIEWGPEMPEFETLGRLTKAMIGDGLRTREVEDDKNSIYFDGIKDGEKGKDLGYYHIRAGSTPAYLLATQKYGDTKTYWDYLKNQPRNELLRHCAWYEYMLQDISPNLLLMLMDMHITAEQFYEYTHRFKQYHNLP